MEPKQSSYWYDIYPTKIDRYGCVEILPHSDPLRPFLLLLVLHIHGCLAGHPRLMALMGRFVSHETFYPFIQLALKKKGDKLHCHTIKKQQVSRVKWLFSFGWSGAPVILRLKHPGRWVVNEPAAKSCNSPCCSSENHHDIHHVLLSLPFFWFQWCIYLSHIYLSICLI